MNVEILPTFLFYSSLSLFVIGLILLLKGSIFFGVFSIALAFISITTWFFQGLFGKFESKKTEDSNDPDADDNEGKGVLKPL